MVLLCLVALGIVVWWLESFGSISGNLCMLGYTSFPCFDFMLDKVSGVCLYMLLCCGLMALFFCFHYFGNSCEASLLFPLIVWFLAVMGLLVLSSSVLFSLVFWEYLGLVSFFLILFYSNSSSLRAAIVTLFASRFGDVSMFMIVMWLSWWSEVSGVVFVVLLLLVVMTKSACYPFISWLLEAMRAPTPVSSLVHSSTLVAAGVWFVLRYNYLGSDEYFSCLVFVCLITIILTAVSAILFVDLKKIVALSTCNNVSWCILFFVFGDLGLALLQLISHGVCKCYLFMSVGDLMSQSSSSQSSVGVFFGRYSGNFLPVIHGFLILSLCGFPFIGVFFSKHMLFSELLYSISWGVGALLFFCLVLSYMYSFRFLLLLLGSMGGLNSGYSAFFFVICPLVFLGSFINFFGVGVMAEDASLGSFYSIIILCFQGLGSILGCWFYFLVAGVGRWPSGLFGCDSYVSIVYSLFLQVSKVCVVSFYRWEVYLFNILTVFEFRSWLLQGTSFFSLNLVVLGLFFVGIFCFII